MSMFVVEAMEVFSDTCHEVSQEPYEMPVVYFVILYTRAKPHASEMDGT